MKNTPTYKGYIIPDHKFENIDMSLNDDRNCVIMCDCEITLRCEDCVFGVKMCAEWYNILLRQEKLNRILNLKLK